MHGGYYVVLRGWTWFTGDSIEAVRAFSALGVGVTAAATVLLVARHQRLRVAVAAGLVTGIVPGLAWTALDGRSYAWSAAFAVLATLALENACRHRKRPRDWVLYGIVCVLACCWHLYLVLLVLGHGAAVMVGFPKGRIPWTLTAIGTAIARRAARPDRVEPAGPGGVADRHELLLGPDAAQPVDERSVRRSGLGPLGLPGRPPRVLRVGHPASLAEGPPLAAVGARAVGRTPDGRRRRVRRRRRRRDAPALRHVRRTGVRHRRDHRRVLAAEVDAGPRRGRRPRGRRSRSCSPSAPTTPSPTTCAGWPPLPRTRTPTRSTSPCRGPAASPPPIPSRSRISSTSQRRSTRSWTRSSRASGTRRRSRASTWPGWGPRLRHPQRPLRRPAARARLPVGAGHDRPPLHRHALHVPGDHPSGPMNESIIAPLPPVGP